MATLTYEDFKQRINIQDLLTDAGYQLNRRDGLRYPSYVRIGSDGRRVHGDKFIVTANGLCCFQPPERKNYNVISFIKEHPQFFAEYHAGMSPDRLVNLVCNRLLNNPIGERTGRYAERRWKAKPFDIGEYGTRGFNTRDFESQKPFYPYFKNRGIDLHTQKAFAGHFFLAAKERSDGRQYTNLAFPLSLAAWPGKQIVGLEERSRPNAEGKTIYKGMASGSNASEGLWIARLENHKSDQGFSKPLGEARHVYWFESAYDAMAYYQINYGRLVEATDRYKQMQSEGTYAGDKEIRDFARELEDLGNSVFISTGGNPSRGQFASLIAETPKAHHHLCFDRDKAGRQFALMFAMQKEGRVFSTHLKPDKPQIVITDLTKKFERYELDMEPFEFHRMCRVLGLKGKDYSYNPCDGMYKDYNDELLQKPLRQEGQPRQIRR